MDPKKYLSELNTHLSYLWEFAKQTNELDFAISLSGEFRGMQDSGWATTITAEEVFNELKSLSLNKSTRSKSELRTMLMLYSQLAEAGGVYEVIKNVMGTLASKPYVLWPFQDLVRVKNSPHRIIGPNSNATFKDLATTATSLGFTKLCSLLETTFRDDIRNGIAHADYVIWNDGLRLRRRNGGNAQLVGFEECNQALTCAIWFFELLQDYRKVSIEYYDPPKEIVGMFSDNPPMPWTISYEPKTGAFGISGSSPGSVTTPEYLRQVAISELLGGKAITIYEANRIGTSPSIMSHINDLGFDPQVVDLPEADFAKLVDRVKVGSLWDQRFKERSDQASLLVTPWGFRTLSSAADFDGTLPEAILSLNFE